MMAYFEIKTIYVALCLLIYMLNYFPENERDLYKRTKTYVDEYYPFVMCSSAINKFKISSCHQTF